ncbi:hypothetical protein FOA52_009175 [Chlamydomonas sp. UWO 241]|nr:hypothetical protein FOA52_009175 [Chlamydomonas sp. UWO 241]
MGVKWLLRWRPTGGVAPTTGDEEWIMAMLDTCFTSKAAVHEPRFEAKCHLMKQLLPPTVTGAAADPSRPGMRDMWVVQSHSAQKSCVLLNRREFEALEADNAMLRIVESKMDYKVKNTVRMDGRLFAKGDFAVRVSTATQTITGVSGQQAFLGHVLEIAAYGLPQLWKSRWGEPSGWDSVVEDARELWVRGVLGSLSFELVKAILDGVSQPLGCENVTCILPVEYMPLNSLTIARALLEEFVSMLTAAVPCGKAGEARGSLELVTPPYEKYASLPGSFSLLHTAVLYADTANALLAGRQG